MTRDSTIRLRHQLVEEAEAIIAAEYADDLQLDDVAHRIGASRRALQRAFTEAGRGTFRDVVREVRMQRAADILMSEPVPVATVARRVGYRQPAQFAKAFRRHLHLPPAQFRAVQTRRDIAA